MAEKKTKTSSASSASKKVVPLASVKKAKATKAKSKTAAKKTVAKKAAVKKVVTKAKAKKAAPAKKVVAKKAAPKKAAPKKVTKKSTASKPVSSTKVGTTKSSPQIVDMLKTIQNMETYKMPTQTFKFDELAQETANASRENVEALIKSGTIFAKGFENWVKTATTFSQSAAEKQAQYAKEIMSSKTLNEAAEAQNKIAQANLDELMSNMAKLSELGSKLLTDTAEPLSEQMNKTIEKASKLAA